MMKVRIYTKKSRIVLQIIENNDIMKVMKMCIYAEKSYGGFMIERKFYLDKLIQKKNNGLIKIITGIRRCGKSYLLFEIYHQYLVDSGVDEACIVEISLDEISNIKYRNPLELDQYIRERVKDKAKQYYVFIDEIQMVSEIKNPYVEDDDVKVGFVDVLLGLMKIKNADIYVTEVTPKCCLLIS